MFHNPSCFIFQHVSDPSIFYLCMLQIPSRFILQRVSDPSIFYLSACFTSLQAVGDWCVPFRPVLLCSRFDALLEMYVSITVILNVTSSSSVDSYQRFERTQYLTLTLKMAAARFSETLAHLSVHVFQAFATGIDQRTVFWVFDIVCTWSQTPTFRVFRATQM